MKKRERARRPPFSCSVACCSLSFESRGQTPLVSAQSAAQVGCTATVTHMPDRASERERRPGPPLPRPMACLSLMALPLSLPRPLSRAGRRRCLSRPCGRPGRAGSGGGRPAGGPGRWRGTAWRTRGQREGRDGIWGECARSVLLRPKTKKEGDGRRRTRGRLSCRLWPAALPPHQRACRPVCEARPHRAAMETQLTYDNRVRGEEKLGGCRAPSLFNLAPPLSPLSRRPSLSLSFTHTHTHTTVQAPGPPLQGAVHHPGRPARPRHGPPGHRQRRLHLCGPL
jgi:hypothetical protein